MNSTMGLGGAPIPPRPPTALSSSAIHASSVFADLCSPPRLEHPPSAAQLQDPHAYHHQQQQAHRDGLGAATVGTAVVVTAGSRYTGWSAEHTQWDSELTTELLWHAHPHQVADEPAAVVPGGVQLLSNADLGLNFDDHAMSVTLSSAGHRSATQSTVATEVLHGGGSGGGAASACDLDAELAGIDVTDPERLRRLCAPLSIDTRCNLCAIISICLRQDAEQTWLLDYSLLCFKCNYAPRTALSTLIVMSEFIHLLRRHFPDLHADELFRHHVLTVFDFHLHFFIHRCFEKQVGDAVENENITLNHLAVVRALVMNEDLAPYTKMRRACQPKQKASAAAASKTPEAPKALLKSFVERSDPGRDRFVQLLFYMWAGTGVMSATPLPELTEIKFNRLDALTAEGNDVNHSDESLPPPEIRKAVGPVYLCPVPVFLTKNQTSTVCLLCELMSCSYYDNLVLRELYRRVTSYCQNNVKMVDRIQLVLADMLRDCATPMGAVQDDVARHGAQVPLADCAAAPGARPDAVFCHVLRQVGVTGIYKHFFCDPQCAGNIRITNEAVLFGRLHPQHLHEMKLGICHDNYYISPLPRRVWLYIALFKAFQIAKRSNKSKTQLTDFVRDFAQLLEQSGIKLVEPSYVVDKYV
ncbi:DNA packaging protein UL32 [Panine betaherpesvirus 2]|uniref:Packaging protein UL32 n=1 Tax=Panine betaherpesvirus 2 TaxID=188763 RepID=Q8QS36_9BETA|nr:DNA packaging protein UL32 [Panine betaherpesvirus 2]AAM00702.1 DNA packaging protein UL32 [Panine betaherpesvirus 2]QXV67807.1 DNA packaging protein UL32 [Panine betaherpesvirus 2]